MTWKGEKVRHGMSARGINTKNLQANGYYEDQGKYYEQRVDLWVAKIVDLLKQENFGDKFTDEQMQSIAYGLIYSGVGDDLHELVENAERAINNLRTYDDLSGHTLKPGKTITIEDEELEVVGIDERGNVITRDLKTNEFRIISEEALLEEYP